MDSSLRENEPGVRQGQKSGWGDLMILVSYIKWLATFFNLSEAEQEAAGIHLEHQGGK